MQKTNFNPRVRVIQRGRKISAIVKPVLEFHQAHEESVNRSKTGKNNKKYYLKKKGKEKKREKKKPYSTLQKKYCMILSFY